MSIEELRKEAEAAERTERIKRGLPPDHLTDFAHFPFAYALDEFARYKATAGEDAHPRKTEPLKLPPVDGAYPTEPAFFFSCDEIYFKSFCLPLLTSIAEHSPGVRCHVHLIDAAPDLERLADALPLTLSFTREESGLLHTDKQTRWTYYNSVRFIRFAEALEHGQGPLWIADVDALVTKGIRPMLSTTAPLAMRMRAGRLRPDEQASACLVLGTARSRAFFRYVADFLKTKEPKWGNDQLALFFAYNELRPNLELIGPEMAGVANDQPGAFWFTAGSEKLSVMKDETPYAREFRRVMNAYLKLAAMRRE